MNILTDALPVAVLVDGREYSINADFRSCLRVILAFEDESLTAIEKAAILIDNLYPEKPTNLQAAFEQGIKFLNGGEIGKEDQAPAPRLFSFAKDARLIYAAFRQTHGIDLETEQDLHWWAFTALFADLGADTSFCTVVALRKRIKSGRATPEDRRIAGEMGEAFIISEPDRHTPAERERASEFFRLAAAGEKARKGK